MLIKREYRWRTIGVATLLIAGLVTLLAVENLLVSALIAFVISYLLAPLIVYLERLGLTRGAAIGLVFATLIGGLVICGRALAPLVAAQFDDLVEKLPTYVTTLQSVIAKSEQHLNRLVVSYQLNLSQRVGTFMQDHVNLWLENLPGLASKIFSISVLAPFLAFFMLKDSRVFSRQILSLVPNKFFELALSLSHQINYQMGAFIRARLIEAMIVGLVVFLGLWAIHFPYAVFLAVFAALANLIPYIGPIIGAVPAFILCLVNQETNLVIILMSMTYLAGQLLDIFVIVPSVVAKVVNLHPIVVVIAIIAGSQVMGVLGMILAIPVASAVKLIVVTIYERLILFRVSS
jgi:putative permease